MNVVLYDPATGRISESRMAPESVISSLGKPYLSVVKFEPDYDATHWVTGASSPSTAIFQARPTMAPTIPTTGSVGSQISMSGLPVGATITVDGAVVGTVDSTGTESVNATDAGAYEIGISLFPYLDFVASVEVS